MLTLYRVCSSLQVDRHGAGSGVAVTRAFGDFHLHPFLVAEPYVTAIDLPEGTGEEGGEDCILVVACDGIWDVLSDDEAADIAQQHTNPLRAALCLRDFALHSGSLDDICVVVVRFDRKHTLKLEALRKRWHGARQKLRVSNTFKKLLQPKEEEEGEDKDGEEKGSRLSRSTRTPRRFGRRAQLRSASTVFGLSQIIRKSVAVYSSAYFPGIYAADLFDEVFRQRCGRLWGQHIHVCVCVCVCMSYRE